jgi:serine protease
MRPTAATRLTVFLLVLCAVQGPSSAAVLYVNQHASGPAHDGASWATAFTTIQAGLAAAHSGDEVWVAAATYTENVTLAAGVGLYGGFKGTEAARDLRSGGATVMDGNANGSVVTIPKGADNSIVDGFTIRNGRAEKGSGLNVAANGVRIVHNVIEKCQANAIFTYGGGAYCSGSSLTVAENVIRDNSLVAADSAYGGGLCFYGGSGRVVNNLFYRNSVSGVDGSDGSAVAAILGAAVDVINNTITSCGGFASRPSYFCFGFAIMADWASTLTVVNNVVAFNANGILGPEDAVRNNLVYRNNRCDYTPVGTNGNVSADPLFVSPGQNDFHLQPLSPGRDAGDDSATEGTTDLDGRPRILGAHVDMGAYELPLGGPYTMGDAASALRIAAGLNSVDPALFERLNVENPGAQRLDLADAIRLARKAICLDANP